MAWLARSSELGLLFCKIENRIIRRTNIAKLRCMCRPPSVYPISGKADNSCDFLIASLDDQGLAQRDQLLKNLILKEQNSKGANSFPLKVESQ